MSGSEANTQDIVFSKRMTVARDRSYLMGVLNINEDSFSGDGSLDVEESVKHAIHAVANGADILDLGAESTRPGADAISAEEEARRLLPVLRAVRERLPDTTISVDTYKPEIFRAAHDAGADMLNVVRDLTDELIDVARDCDVPIIVTHPGLVSQDLKTVVETVLHDLTRDARRLRARGVAVNKILLDYGIGFGKTPEQNIALLGALSRLVELGYPTLLGASRKSTLGMLTGRGVGERVYATAATTALAAAARIDIMRVHDVSAMRDVVRVCDAVVRN